jgi:putative ATPase
MALRNAPTSLMKEIGYGDGYVYAPATEEGVGGIECLPQALAGERFYRPGGDGFEAELKTRLERFRSLRQRVGKP